MGEGQKKIVLELLTAHGTLASPDTINYILSKEEPEQYIENILKNFHEMPLFLTVDQLKAAESSSDVKLEIFVEEKLKDEIDQKSNTINESKN